MKKMTIADLAIYLKRAPAREYSFHTSGQKWFDDFGIYPVQRLKFTGIEICVNPNCVMLYDADSRMTFSNLKYAYVGEENPFGDRTIILVGEDFYHDGKDVEYCLITG